MAELFQTDRTSMVRHINKIYADDELDRDSTCAKIAQVQKEGQRTVRRRIPYFNLDMIISVGYRVNSKRGIKFRQWANRVLKQYLIKGYAINERLRHEQISELRQLTNSIEFDRITNSKFIILNSYLAFARTIIRKRIFKITTMGLFDFLFGSDESSTNGLGT